MIASAEIRTVSSVQEVEETVMVPTKKKILVSTSEDVVSLMITKRQSEVLRTILGTISGFDGPDGVRVASDGIYNALVAAGVQRSGSENSYEQFMRVKPVADI